MSLLVDTTGAALDPSYAEAAEARRNRPGQPAPRLSGLLLVGILVVGLGIGVAGVQVRQHAHQVGTAQRALVRDVNQRTAETDRLAAQAARLRSDVAQTRDRTLRQDERGRAAAEQVAALELATGSVAVHGPGLKVTLSDASGSATAAARGGQPGDGRIYDRDVQDVVNALWAAGAEAVSINGQRVTVETAIRSAGEAILVDLRPLSSPYVLEAVGPVDSLEPTFVDSPTARRFQTWTSLYGLGFTVRRARDLRLPAASEPTLHLATPEPVPSTTSTPGGSP